LTLRISAVQSSRQSTEQFSVAPTIEDVVIKDEPAVDYDHTEEEDDGEESEGREGRGEKQVSGFRRHYSMGVRRAHIVRSVEVDGR
jgi:hypothetical protein